MAELTISINNRPFQIACPDGEEQHVSRLAEDLAGRLGDVKQSAGDAGDSLLLVLVGLTLCDELRQNREKIEKLQNDIKLAGEQTDKLQNQIGEVEQMVAKSLTVAAEKMQAVTNQISD